ncbi:MAG: 2-oxo-4-hydroxy-4-carboxy-5-ureidoimidazoline decarboxylase, partial [Polyangiaceae bacterium]
MSTPAEPPHAEPPHAVPQNAAPPNAVLNAMTSAEAHAALLRCCGAERWVLAMLERRPFASERELMYAADDVWASLGPDDYLAAFAHHP